MTHHAHDVGLMALLIDGVTHGFTVYGQAFIRLPIGLVPALQGMVQRDGINADKDIAEDGETGDDVAPVFSAAAETLSCLLTETIGPI